MQDLETSRPQCFLTEVARSSVQGIKALSSHTSFIHAVAWQPASEVHVATASMDKSLKLWDTRSSIPLSTLEGHEEQVGLCNAGAH